MTTIAPAEWVWLTVNGASTILTIYALLDAQADQRTVKALNGRAREIAVERDVRRGRWLLLAQVLLLAAVIPGLFIDRPINLVTEAGPNWVLIALMLVPLALLMVSIDDARSRKALAEQLAHDMATERRRKGDG